MKWRALDVKHSVPLVVALSLICLSVLYSGSMKSRRQGLDQVYLEVQERSDSFAHLLRLLSFEAFRHAREGAVPVLDTRADAFCSLKLHYPGERQMPDGQFYAVFTSPDDCDRGILGVAPGALRIAPLMSYLSRSLDEVERIFFVSMDARYHVFAPAPELPFGSFEELRAAALQREHLVQAREQTERLLAGEYLVSGPYRDQFSGEMMITLTVGVQADGVLEGTLNIDLQIHELDDDDALEHPLWVNLPAPDAPYPVLSRELKGSIALQLDNSVEARISYFVRHCQTELLLMLLVLAAITGLYYRHSVSAERMRLVSRSSTDSLTGLLNRHGLDDLLSCHRWESGVAVLAFDLDDFKHVNDHFGHAAGDLVLQAFASCARAQVRQGDYLFRMGGEEFVLLATDTETIEAASALAERIRSTVASTEVRYKDQRISVTTSCGIAMGAGLNGIDAFEVLMERADQQLYRAKREGKNRVCIA